MTNHEASKMTGKKIIKDIVSGIALFITFFALLVITP